jgi:predicted aspartyl protease
MKNFRYRNHKGMPAPVVPAIVSASTSPQKFKISFRLDTGADSTLLTSNTILELDADLLGEVVVADFEGVESIRRTYSVNLLIGRRYFRDVEVIASEGGPALLGLNVLNQLNLNLNGPKRQLSILEVTTQRKT